jgi:flagellum-specific ATP synthase
VRAARAAAQDLLDVGAYQPGANPLVDAAVDHQAEITAFLTQRIDESSDADTSWRALGQLVLELGGI